MTDDGPGPARGRERLFFALWPDPAVRTALAGAAAERAAACARPVPVENLHLTLVFLGGVPLALRPCLGRAAAAAAADASRFVVRLDRVGHWRRSRVLWLAPAAVPDALRGLRRRLEAALAPCGHVPETRSFRPHVTLARGCRGGEGEVATSPVPWEVTAIRLVRSETRPAGARYEVVGSWSLG